MKHPSGWKSPWERDVGSAVNWPCGELSAAPPRTGFAMGTLQCSEWCGFVPSMDSRECHRWHTASKGNIHALAGIEQVSVSFTQGYG